MWENALRTVNKHLGTSQVYKEGCTKYNCSGGPPVPKDVEISSVAVGSAPFGSGVNNVTNRVYVSNSGSGSVSVIDGSTNTVLATIAVGSSPQGVGVNPATNRVYVSNSGSGSVSVIDGSTNTVLTTITVGTSPKGGVGVNPATNRVYVSNYGSSSVSVIDGSTNTVLTTIAVEGVVFGVSVNPSNNHVYVANDLFIPGTNTVSSGAVIVIDGASNNVINNATTEMYSIPQALGGVEFGVNPTTRLVYPPGASQNAVSIVGQREEIREACLQGLTKCLVVSSTGTLFPGTAQATSVNMVAVSLSSNATKIGTQMALTLVCDNNTIDPNQRCSAFYVDGNVWGPDRQDLSKSPFIIVNAEPYFYLQFHWWDFANSRIVVWGYWWNDSHNHPNWYWGVYWWWRTYVNYYIGIWLPWWWWVWHWTYWRYWNWWSTEFSI